MSRFKYLLESATSTDVKNSKYFGLFPFNSLVDKNASDIHSGKLEFLESAVEGLKLLASKNYSVIVFINQFKNKKLSFEHFQSLNQAIENFINSYGVKVHSVYWCPGTDRNDPFVVPNPGMFTRATENLEVSWNNVPVISTSDDDLLAADRAGGTPIKISNGSSKWTHYATFLNWVETIK